MRCEDNNEAGGRNALLYRKSSKSAVIEQSDLARVAVPVLQCWYGTDLPPRRILLLRLL